MTPPEAAVTLRPARERDLTFVAHVYARAMGEVLRRSGLNMAGMGALFAAQWIPAEISIICAADRNVGWVQVAVAPDALFLRNFCIDPAYQRLGIGSAVLRRVIEEAANGGGAVSLAVAKGNPARRLYERFGFRITHEDEEHHFMRRETSERRMGGH